MKYVYAFSLMFLLVLAGCDDDPVGTPHPNQRPETQLATPTVETIQSSQIHVYWYGDDPDGLVTGYLFSWNGSEWFYTTKNDSLFSLRISSNDSSYTFAVAAVDNSLADTSALSRPITFADTDGNGVYTDGEEFTGLAGAVDLTPARVSYRIVNSAPEVYFGADSTAASRAVRQNPDTTFPVASFLFSVYDRDGASTISSVEWALNDSSATVRWNSIPAGQTLLTLREADGIVPDADNVLYLRATDKGGKRSVAARYPAAGSVWYVKKPKGELLLIKDFTAKDADDFYTQALNGIAGGRFAGAYDILDIREGGSQTTRPTNLPLFISPTFVETLKLFKAVIWYGDLKPSLELAQQVLPEFNRAGGRVLFVTGLPTSVEATGALVDFTPVDSVSTLELPGFPQALKNGSVVSASPAVSPLYPDLIKEKGSVAGIHALYPKVTASVLYRLPDNDVYGGTPVVGVRSGARDFVFLNFPLHLFNAEGRAVLLLDNVLTQEFGM